MNNKDIIFAPSLSNDRTLSNRLTSFISKNKIFQLYIKCNEQTEITNVIIKPFFNTQFYQLWWEQCFLERWVTMA
jgi:hypothetical protein